MSFGATPLSTTSIGANQFPASAVAEPGHANGDFTALEGGPGSVDSNNNRTAPMSIYVKDGGDVALGTTTDLSSANTLIGLMKAIKTNTASVTIGSGSITANAGTNLNTSALALETGGNLAAIVAALDDGQETMANSLSVVIASDQSAVPVSGTFWQSTQPISAASLPLPSGAATSAKQAALGTAGSASTDVLSVQGIASMTPLTVAQATGSNLHAVLDSGSTTAVTQATASNLNAQVVGAAASGASNSGNPVKVGGAFNTTQPTVTTGQAVDAQYTARGSAIVATGVDPFAVNASQAGTWNVTNISGTISLPTGAAQDSSVNGILLSQASTTSGQKGSLVQGAVTTNAPSYTTGQTDPLSLDTSGLLRVSFKDTPANTNNLNVALAASSATVTVSATNLQTNLNQIAGSNVATAAAGIQKVGLTDGTGTALTSTSNALDVNIKSGGGSGFSVVDEASWTAGTSAFVPTGGVFNDSAAALTSGQEGSIRLTNNRAIHVNLRDASANQLLGSKTSANSIPVVVASDQGAVAVSGTFWQTTQPVSGTVTANIGTTNGVALDTSVNGILVSQGSTTSGEKGPMVQGAVTTNAPSYTTAQTSPLSLDTSGLLRMSLKDTPANTNNLNVAIAASSATVTVSGSITANAGTNLNTSALALETGGNLATLAGAVSSSKVQVNTAFINGVAPTMGNGVSGTGVQRVTIASDSTGQVTLASGAATIGAVTQASGPWTENLTQIAGSNVSTAASGIQKVGIVGNAGASVDSTVGAGTAPTNAVAVASVYNTSAPTPTNGQAMAIQADQAGNTRTFPGIALATLSAWNSGTSLNATQNIFTNSGAEAVLVQLTQTTTLTGGAVTFEVSYDNSNWSTIPANCVLDPTSNTFAQISVPYTVQASTNKIILLNMNGAQGLRIKLSTQITGSGAVTPNYALLPASPADTVIALSPTAANFLVTASQGGSNWSTNVAQFGGNNVATGTGAGGSGIPRVTVSNDSTVGSNSATGSTVPANAFYSGGDAATSLPTAASAGNLTGAMYDKFGRQVVLPGSIRDLRATQTTTISNSSSETTIFTAVSSVFLDVVMFIFSNTSGTATRIDIRDTTAGTVLGSVYVPAGDMRGFAVPGETIPQTSVNTNWTATCATAVTDIRVYALVDKNK